MYLITVDSNLKNFAKFVTDVITAVSIEDVVDVDSVLRETATNLQYVDLTGADNGAVTCKRKTQNASKKLYTVKSRWCGPDLIPDTCVSVARLCAKVNVEYENFDLVLCDTPKSAKAYGDAERCMNRQRISYVYVNGSDARYVESWRPLNGERVVMILDNFAKQMKIPSEYVIYLRRHNCTPATVGRFVAYLIKSFQRNGRVLDVSKPPSLDCNDFYEAPKRAVVSCNIYDFVEKIPCLQTTLTSSKESVAVIDDCCVRKPL